MLTELGKVIYALLILSLEIQKQIPLTKFASAYNN